MNIGIAKPIFIPVFRLWICGTHSPDRQIHTDAKWPHLWVCVCLADIWRMWWQCAGSQNVSVKSILRGAELWPAHSLSHNGIPIIYRTVRKPINKRRKPGRILLVHAIPWRMAILLLVDTVPGVGDSEIWAPLVRFRVSMSDWSDWIETI